MRQPLMGAAIGMRSSGKTWETNELIKKYVAGDLSIGVKPRRVLIFDVNNEFSHIKHISPADVKRFSVHPKVEARRIGIFKNDGKGTQKMSLDEYCDVVLKSIHDCYGMLVLVEDINKYVSDSLPSDLIGHIVTLRHLECDTIFHMQQISRIAHPKIWGNLSWIRMHHCEDNVKTYDARFGGETTHMKIAQELVDKKYYACQCPTEVCTCGLRYSHCYISKNQLKVRGNFSEDEFKGAIDDYLSKNYIAIKNEFNRIDLNTGKKMYADERQVIDLFRNQYFKKYYGN